MNKKNKIKIISLAGLMGAGIMLTGCFGSSSNAKTDPYAMTVDNNNNLYTATVAPTAYADGYGDGYLSVDWSNTQIPSDCNQLTPEPSSNPFVIDCQGAVVPFNPALIFNVDITAPDGSHYSTGKTEDGQDFPATNYEVTMRQPDPNAEVYNFTVEDGTAPITDTFEWTITGDDGCATDTTTNPGTANISCVDLPQGSTTVLNVDATDTTDSTKTIRAFAQFVSIPLVNPLEDAVPSEIYPGFEDAYSFSANLKPEVQKQASGYKWDVTPAVSTTNCTETGQNTNILTIDCKDAALTAPQDFTVTPTVTIEGIDYPAVNPVTQTFTARNINNYYIADDLVNFDELNYSLSFDPSLPAPTSYAWTFTDGTTALPNTCAINGENTATVNVKCDLLQGASQNVLASGTFSDAQGNSIQPQPDTVTTLKREVTQPVESIDTQDVPGQEGQSDSFQFVANLANDLDPTLTPTYKWVVSGNDKDCSVTGEATNTLVIDCAGKLDSGPTTISATLYTTVAGADFQSPETSQEFIKPSTGTLKIAQVNNAYVQKDFSVGADTAITNIDWSMTQLPSTCRFVSPTNLSVVTISCDGLDKGGKEVFDIKVSAKDASGTLTQTMPRVGFDMPLQSNLYTFDDYAGKETIVRDQTDNTLTTYIEYKRTDTSSQATKFLQLLAKNSDVHVTPGIQVTDYDVTYDSTPKMFITNTLIRFRVDTSANNPRGFANQQYSYHFLGDLYIDDAHTTPYITAQPSEVKYTPA